MKKILAMLMAIAMVITLLPAYALAEDVASDASLFESVGSPVMRTQLINYALTKQDGKPVMVGVASGNPANLMVIDLETKKLISDFELDYGKTFYSYAVDSKGDVYMAGYSAPLKIYKYSVTDKTVTAVSDTKAGSYTATAICDMAFDENDNLYLGTYPKSHILKWDGSKLTDLVSVYANKTLNILPDETCNDDDYAKSMVYHNGSLFVGGFKEGTYLVEYNTATGNKTKYDLPAIEGVRIKNMYHANKVANKMFIFCQTVSSGQYMLVFNLDTKKWDNVVPNYSGSYASASSDGKKAYVVIGIKLKQYDLATDTISDTKFTGNISAIHTKSSISIGGADKVVYATHGQNYISIIDPATGRIDRYDDVLPKYPDMIESFMLDSNGDIYASSYQGGLSSKYDPYKKEILAEFSTGQASVIKEIDGKVYFGGYPNDDLYVFDPSQPVTKGTNPKELFRMPEENQGRPMDLVKAGNYLVMSSIGGYGDADGKSTGTLAVYNLSTGELKKFKGGDMDGYQMIGLYYDEDSDRLFVTTGIVGGHNSTPVHDRAKMFYVYFSDLLDSDGEIITEDEITIKTDHFTINHSYNKNISMCGGIAKDPNENKLWVACYNGIFTVDMDDFEITDTISIDEGPYYASRWQPYKLEFAANGDLYATPGDKLIKIDPTTMTYVKLAESVHDIALSEGASGTAVYTMSLKGTEIFVMNKQPEIIKPDKIDDVYQIKTYEDFLYIKQEPQAKYKLVNDITVGTADAPFTAPFGFSGELDGNGKTITANIVATGATGLFATQPTIGGKITIKNLTLKGTIKRTDAAATDTSSYSDASVGGLIGYAANHTLVNIENCVNHATIIGGAAGYAVGGLIGRLWGNYFSVIKNSYNYGAVSSGHGSSHVGGIAGMYSGTITECANSGNVTKPDTGSYYAAGIAGILRKGAKIEKSANFGFVKGPWAAGIVGYITELDKSNGVDNFTIENCFNAGTITGNATAGGASGIIGTRDSTYDSKETPVTLVLTNNYNGGPINANRTAIFACISGDNVATTTATNQWYVGTYGTYARLPAGTFNQINNNNNTLEKLKFDPSIWTWDTSVYPYPYITSVGLAFPFGTEMNPFQITSFEDFLKIKDAPEAYYKLMNDITVGTADAPFTEPFPFYGNFDGNGKTITANIKASGQPVGLFSEITDGAKNITIKNLTLNGRVERTDAAGANDEKAVVGGLLGYTANYVGIRIDNCVNNADIIGNGAKMVGGLVGRTYAFASDRPTDGVHVTNCTNNGTITTNYEAGSFIGGLFGAGSGTVTNCTNTGKISGKCAYMGGIAGVFRKTLDVSNCVNLADITTAYSNGVGGIMGTSNSLEGKMIIKNAFNAGNISNAYNSSASGSGGIAGRGWDANQVVYLEDCYNSGTISCARADHANPIVGYLGNSFVATDVWFAGEGADATVAAAKPFGANTTLAQIGFDSAVWEWNTASGYPYPIFIGMDIETGTDTFPITIETKEDFLAICNNPTGSYIIANDIDLGEYEPFTFKGTLKGTVKEDGTFPVLTVNINQPKKIGVGLFSNIDGTVKIENIEVAGKIVGGGATGGIAGFAGDVDYNGTTCTLMAGSYIKNCINRARIQVVKEADVTGTYTGRCAGGIIGMYRHPKGSRNLTISDVTNYGYIYAQLSYAGGIAGNIQGTIDKAANYGEVYTDNCIGGIVGFGYDNRPITNSFNAGYIHGNACIGGIVGRWQHPGGGKVIENCYNVGSVLAIDVAKTNYHGTILGDKEGNGEANIVNCYNAGSLNGSWGDTVMGVRCAGTLTNVFSLTIYGDDDSDANTLGIAGLENAAAKLGSAFKASENDFPFPQIAAVENDQALPLVMIDNLSVTNAEGVDGKVMAFADIATNLKDKDVMFVLAVYDADGRLVKADMDKKAISKAGAEFSVENTLGADCTYKLMVTDSSLVPYIDAIAPLAE